VQTFLDQLISMAEPVQLFFRWRPQLRDPGDELVLDAAVNGQANAIVTFNEKDLREARAGFGIEVLRPGEILWRLKS
jgi:predicted nucleic acid-binding protein